MKRDWLSPLSTVRKLFRSSVNAGNQFENRSAHHPEISEGNKSHACQWGNHLGKSAPISRNSFVVSSNRGVSTSSKVVSSGASRTVGPSRRGRTRRLF